MDSNYGHGGDIYGYTKPPLDFSANLNPLGFPKGVREAVLSAMEEDCHYPDPFCRALTRALAEREGVPPCYVLCGNGAADLIYRFVWATKPRRALLPAPCFSEYEQALRTVGADIQFHPLKPEENFHLTEAILPALRPELDCLFLCHPNNPTGHLIAHDLLYAVLKKARELGILVVLDECFLDLTDAGEPASAKPWLGEFPNLFQLNAFTKTYAMAGLRLGYALCSDAALRDAVQACGQPWAVSSVAQAAGVAALQDTAYLSRTRALLQAERAYLRQALARLPLRLWDSQANFLFFQAWRGLQQALLQRGILIRSCANYRGLDDTYYRIAVRTRVENEQLIRAMNALGGK